MGRPIKYLSPQPIFLVAKIKRIFENTNFIVTKIQAKSKN
nr:MAG TPA: hypothetical protein [Caudoviricetes sp.]